MPRAGPSLAPIGAIVDDATQIGAALLTASVGDEVMRIYRKLAGPALAACAGIAALTIAAPSVAVAEPVQLAQFDYRGVPPHEVAAIVRSMGLNPVGTPLRRGRDYVQHAVDRRGEQVRVIIDARFGDVVAVRRLYARGPYDDDRPDVARRMPPPVYDRPDYSRRMPPPYYRDDDDDMAPRPPAVVGPPPVRGYEPDPRLSAAPPSAPPTDGPRVIYGPDRDIKDPPHNAAPPPPSGRPTMYVPPGTTTPPAARAKRTPVPKARPNVVAADRPPVAAQATPPAPPPPPGPVVRDVEPAPSVAPSPGQFPQDAPLDE
jgi:hypothetical protein